MEKNIFLWFIIQVHLIQNAITMLKYIYLTPGPISLFFLNVHQNCLYACVPV